MTLQWYLHIYTNWYYNLSPDHFYCHQFKTNMFYTSKKLTINAWNGSIAKNASNAIYIGYPSNTNKFNESLIRLFESL